LVDVVKLLRRVRLTVKKVDEIHPLFDKFQIPIWPCKLYSINGRINCNRKT